MNTISYKGYLGTVNFSEKDECFYGKIEGNKSQKIWSRISNSIKNY